MSVKTFILYLLLATIFATCASAARGDTRWHVILAAVGNEQNVFGNFVNDFANILMLLMWLSHFAF